MGLHSEHDKKYTISSPCHVLPNDSYFGFDFSILFTTFLQNSFPLAYNHLEISLMKDLPGFWIGEALYFWTQGIFKLWRIFPWRKNIQRELCISVSLLPEAYYRAYLMKGAPISVQILSLNGPIPQILQQATRTDFCRDSPSTNQLLIHLVPPTES